MAEKAEKKVHMRALIGFTCARHEGRVSEGDTFETTGARARFLEGAGPERRVFAERITAAEAQAEEDADG